MLIVNYAVHWDGGNHAASDAGFSLEVIGHLAWGFCRGSLRTQQSPALI